MKGTDAPAITLIEVLRKIQTWINDLGSDIIDSHDNSMLIPREGVPREHAWVTKCFHSWFTSNLRVSARLNECIPAHQSSNSSDKHC